MSELAWLIGEWTEEGDASKVDVVYKWIANKHFIRAETKVHADESAEKNNGSPESVGGTQIIGRDPFTGQIVSWSFSADGGHGFGIWTKDGKRWLIHSEGATVDGVPSVAVNVLYRADDNVISWQSVDRTLDGQPLPDTKEVVLDRKTTSDQPQSR
jgi:hypothetical protein